MTHQWSWTCAGSYGGSSMSCEASEQFCGDSIVQTDHTETCDDGNQTPGDGCNLLCHIESGYQCPNSPYT